MLVGAVQNKFTFVFETAFAKRPVGGFGAFPDVGVGVGVPVEPVLVVGQEALELDDAVKVIVTSFDLPLAPSE